MAENVKLKAQQKNILPLTMKTASGATVIIPPDVIRTVSELPENPEIGTVVALVSDDETKINGFYIATEKTDEGTVWTLYVTSQTSSSEIADGAIRTEKLADEAVTHSKIARGAVGSTNIAVNSIYPNHLVDFAVTENKIADKSVNTAKIKDKSITKDKIDDEVFKEWIIKPFVEEALDFEKIDLPDDFEGYTDVIHLSDPLPKDWSKVKIWSADDGLVVPDSQSPYDFDFSKITETNHATIGTLPRKIDFTSLEGKSVASSIVLVDEKKPAFWLVTFIKNDDSFILPVSFTSAFYDFDLVYLKEGDSPSNAPFTATSEGWYKVYVKDGTVTAATNEDLSVFSGTYENLKILDWGSLNADAAEAFGISDFSPEFLLNLFLKDFISFVYPPGYYLTERTGKYATKKDIAEINEKLDTLVPKTWADVQQVVRSGQAPKVFSVGDQLICAKNGIVHVWDIIGFDYDTPLNPNYHHSMTLQLNTVVESRAFDSDSHDYSSSDIRAYLNSDYLTGFDEDFLSVIGGIRKSDLLYNTEDNIYPESDIFFLLSEAEVSTSPYEFYSSSDVDPTIRIKTVGISSIGIVGWWLRTALNDAATVSKIVYTDGVISTGTITRNSYYIAPACVIY